MNELDLADCFPERDGEEPDPTEEEIAASIARLPVTVEEWAREVRAKVETTLGPSIPATEEPLTDGELVERISAVLARHGVFWVKAEPILGMPVGGGSEVDDEN